MRPRPSAPKSPGVSAPSAAAVVAWSGRRGSAAPCARRRRARHARASSGARRGCPRTAPAWNSRRTAPCARRARRAGRAAACGGAGLAEFVGHRVPARALHESAATAPVRAPSVRRPERFPAAVAAGYSFGGRPDMRRRPLSRASLAFARSLSPESFRGGCSFGAPPTDGRPGSLPRGVVENADRD